jgi:hypothetical protein
MISLGKFLEKVNKGENWEGKVKWDNKPVNGVCRNKRGVLMDKNKPFYWVDYRREKK